MIYYRFRFWDRTRNKVEWDGLPEAGEGVLDEQLGDLEVGFAEGEA